MVASANQNDIHALHARIHALEGQVRALKFSLIAIVAAGVGIAGMNLAGDYMKSHPSASMVGPAAKVAERKAAPEKPAAIVAAPPVVKAPEPVKAEAPHPVIAQIFTPKQDKPQAAPKKTRGRYIVIQHGKVHVE